MKRFYFQIFAVAIMLFSVQALKAQAVTNSNLSHPDLPPTIYNVCTGEDMHYVSGKLNLYIHQVTLPNGKIMNSLHFNAANVVYVGAQSGTTYHLMENVTQKTITTGSSFSQSFTDYIRFISQGNTANYQWKREFSYTVDFTASPPVVVTSDVLTQNRCK